MQNILQSIGLEEMRELQRDEAGAIFNDFVKRRITINYKGEILSDKTAADAIDPLDKLDAFNINLRKEYSRFVKPILRANKGNDEAIEAAFSTSTDIHFPIPENDNARRSINLYCALLKDTIINASKFIEIKPSDKDQEKLKSKKIDAETVKKTEVKSI